METRYMTVTRYPFYDSIIQRGGHTLVAGTNGSGKSVVLNGLIVTAICEGAQLILLDPKGGVEFNVYRDTLDCIGYGGDLDEFKPALEKAIRIMDDRYRRMSAAHIRKSNEQPVYVIIDEYADMMSERKKELQPLLLKLARKGRAANVRLVLATQSPYRSIITGDIRGNMVNFVALRVTAKTYSRLILEDVGAETLNVGEALVKLNGEFEAHRECVPMYSEENLEQIALWRTPPSKRWK